MRKGSKLIIMLISIFSAFSIPADAEVIEGVDSNKDPKQVLTDSAGRLITSGYNMPTAKFDDDATGNCVSITSTSTQFTLPGSAGDWYCVGSAGNTAYILCNSNPTATTAVGGHSLFVTSGATKCRRLTGPKCAVIGTTTTGEVCFEHLNPSL